LRPPKKKTPKNTGRDLVHRGMGAWQWDTPTTAARLLIKPS